MISLKYKWALLLLFVAPVCLGQQKAIHLQMQVLNSSPPHVYTDREVVSLESTNNTLLFTIIADSSLSKAYQYRVKGLDSTWLPIQNHSSVWIAHLMGGNYVFEVRHAQHLGIRQAFSFEIKPLLWQEKWFLPAFYALVGTFFIMANYLFSLYRIRQKTKEFQLRNKIAHDLHDDVGSTLTSIALLGQKAMKRLHDNPDTDIQPFLEKIISFSQESSESMRGIVMAINPKNDDTGSFIEKLSAYLRDSLAQSDIQCVFEHDEQEAKYSFGLEQRRTIFLLLKEISQNIRKHSQATQAHISIKNEDNQISILVKDNGIGFVLGQKIEGNGLASIGQRIKELRGDLKIKSQLGEGTSIELLIPTLYSGG